MVTVKDPVSRAEIAKMLGVTTRTVQRYTERPDWPSPAMIAGRVRIWKRRDIERWAAATLPLPSGRPPRRAE
jgi:predicted DNA-binding transcriptional regulator AlpA